jgi:hypothetical protein
MVPGRDLSGTTRTVVRGEERTTASEGTPEAEEPDMLVHDAATTWRLVRDRQEKLAAGSERVARRAVWRRRPRRTFTEPA